MAEVDLRLTFPSRKTLSSYMLPSLARETKEQYAVKCIRDSLAVSLTFDLWMSRGSKDVFSVICHWLDDKLDFQTRHMEMIQMDGTSGTDIPLKLSRMLQDFNLCSKIVAHVTDGGSNLATCTRQLIGTVKFSCFDLDISSHGIPWKGMSV